MHRRFDEQHIGDAIVREGILFEATPIGRDAERSGSCENGYCFLHFDAISGPKI